MASILIIEDNDQLRGILKEMLTRADYQVIVASDGGEGVEMYREKLPDLVITDVIMPEKDGAGVIFELQKDYPDVKMIVMTGGGQGDAQTYLKSIMAYSNVKHAFEKPFAMEDLLKTVKELIDDA